MGNVWIRVYNLLRSDTFSFGLEDAMGILGVMLKETSAEQIQFICKEMNIRENALQAMSEEELYDVYEAMRNIEIEEACKLQDDEEIISERGNMAADIVTLWGNAMAKADGFYRSQDLEILLKDISDMPEDVLESILERLEGKKVHMKLLIEYLETTPNASRGDISQILENIFSDENAEKEALRCELWECLLAVPDAYYDFVGGVSSLLSDDVGWQRKMIQYIKDNPKSFMKMEVQFGESLFP